MSDHRTEISSNAKAHAWDAIGSMFWELGRSTAKPTDREVQAFLSDLPVRDGRTRVAIIGASTLDLIVAAAAKAQVSVFDFSQRMCADLVRELGERGVSVDGVHQLDITAPVPSCFHGAFDVVLSDRLINRFTEDESCKALRGMETLLTPSGEIRASIKLGLYPMDERMLAAAQEALIEPAFFDRQTRTIDYAKAGEMLDSNLVPHGSIPRESLLQWYRGRGKEKRFSDSDVRQLCCEALGTSCIVFAVDMPDAPATCLYTVR